MSKKIKLPVALLILICLSAGSLAFQTTVPVTRTHAQAGAAAGAAQNAAIVSTTDAVLKETSELRELSIMRPVKSGAQSRAEIERMIVRNLNEDRFYTLLQRSDGVYAQVGVGPKAAAGPGEYALEHRDGPAGEQLRAATTDQDEAVRFLQSFRAGEDWRGTHSWRRLDL